MSKTLLTVRSRIPIPKCKMLLGNKFVATFMQGLFEIEIQAYVSANSTCLRNTAYIWQAYDIIVLLQYLLDVLCLKNVVHNAEFFKV